MRTCPMIGKKFAASSQVRAAPLCSAPRLLAAVFELGCAAAMDHIVDEQNPLGWAQTQRFASAQKFDKAMVSTSVPNQFCSSGTVPVVHVGMCRRKTVFVSVSGHRRHEIVRLALEDGQAEVLKTEPAAHRHQEEPDLVVSQGSRGVSGGVAGALRGRARRRHTRRATDLCRRRCRQLASRARLDLDRRRVAGDNAAAGDGAPDTRRRRDWAGVQVVLRLRERRPARR